MKTLKERGWMRSGIDRLKTWALADNLGMILSDVTRYKTDGSVLEKLRACYMVRRDGNAWKIVTISEIKAPFLGPGDLAREGFTLWVLDFETESRRFPSWPNTHSSR